MKERSFDEMIAYFNRRVSEMDIAQDCKMELLGMVTALGFKHEKSAQPEIIHCKECRWWNRINDTKLGYCHACKHEVFSKKWGIMVWRKSGEDWFCGDGEREGE